MGLGGRRYPVVHPRRRSRTHGYQAVVTVDLEPAHLVGTGGAIGAVLRYWVGQRISGVRAADSRWRRSRSTSSAVSSSDSRSSRARTSRRYSSSAPESVARSRPSRRFPVETVRLYERGGEPSRSATPRRPSPVRSRRSASRGSSLCRVPSKRRQNGLRERAQRNTLAIGQVW